MRSLVAAFRFLTRIPVPGPATKAEDLAWAVGWFPLVGAVVGLGTAGAFGLALRLWPPMVAAVLAVAFGLLLTGGFHEDGLTDATDGLGGGWTRERILEIMKDSRIGAYGSMALWATLTLRWACLVAMGGRALWLLPLAMVWGRWSVCLILRLLPSISQGLAKEVHKDLRWGAFAFATLLLLAANLGAWRLGIPHLGRTGLAAILATLFWVLYLRHRLGGHSGDTLGAGNQIAEAAALLAMLVA
nr:adenosylcobinamide-GDP ribazoletransferase [uncultured Holophaga sp.]